MCYYTYLSKLTLSVDEQVVRGANTTGAWACAVGTLHDLEGDSVVTINEGAGKVTRRDRR
jgi:hypothetical protein